MMETNPQPLWDAIPSNGKQGLRREFSGGTSLAQPPPHPGTSLFCPPRRCGAGQGQKASSLKGKALLTAKMDPGKATRGGGGGEGVEEACVSAAGSNW